MITLVIGGSGSGKSAYAESLLEGYVGTKYYLATMQVYDEEGRQKVQRHRKLREGKGFCTIEQPYDLDRVKERLAGKTCALLLECVSNLAANEMFRGNQPYAPEIVAEKITADIISLSKEAEELVIVTVNVFEDGIVYDDSTMQYMQALAQVNCGLAEMADTVTEVVVGIPVSVKSEGKKQRRIK